MKKIFLLNAQLSYKIATLGHTESLTICDAGLPIPQGVDRIDLALSHSVPSFLQVLEATLSELFVERVVLAEEIKQKNPQIFAALMERFAQLEQTQGNKIQIEFVPHNVFKQHSVASKAIIRSGECSPYANVILYSGVPF